jgi:tetratricopeptide (TPR) repeat protein
MSASQLPSPARPQTAREAAELEALRRMLGISRGCFSLSIAVCNSPALRDYLIDQVRATEPAVEVLQIPTATTDVFAAASAVHNPQRTALFVIGLEQSVVSANADHPALRSLNASRELWERTFPCPVVFWVPDYVSGLLSTHAPDWWRYRSHSFEFVSEQADVPAGLAGQFEGDVEAAASLPGLAKRLRIAELKQRLPSAAADSDASLVPHVLTWLNELGILYHALGDLRRANRYHDQQLALARQIGDRRAEASALTNLAQAYLELGDPRRAIELFERALEISRATGHRRGETIALGGLAIAYTNLGKPHRAMEFCEQQLAATRAMGDWHAEGNALGALGYAFAALGETRRAIELYEQWLKVAYLTGNRRGHANALNNLANAYAALGDPRRAIEFSEQSLDIARATGDQRAEAYARWSMALAFEELADLPRAAELMQSLVDYERQIGHPDAEKHAAHLAALRARIR